MLPHAFSFPAIPATQRQILASQQYTTPHSTHISPYLHTMSSYKLIPEDYIGMEFRMIKLVPTENGGQVDLQYIGWARAVTGDGRLYVVWGNPYAFKPVIHEVVDIEMIKDHIVDPETGRTPVVPLFNPVSGRLLPTFFNMANLPEDMLNHGMQRYWDKFNEDMNLAQAALEEGADPEAQAKPRGKCLVNCIKAYGLDEAVVVDLTADSPPAKTLGGKRQRTSTGNFSGEDSSSTSYAEAKGSDTSSEGTPEIKWTCLEGCCSDQVGLILSDTEDEDA